MHDVDHFTLEDMSRLGGALRRAGQGAQSMDELAGRVVRHLHDSLRERLREQESGAPSCVSVRFFKTHLVEELPADLRLALAPRDADYAAPPKKCLVLLATAGLAPLGDDALLSHGTRVIPLAEDETRTAPSFRALVTQLGLDVASLVALEPAYAGEASHRTCHVFRTEDVPGAIAAQGVRSILGFGGLLPSGNLFFVLLYLRTVISADHAEMFRPVAINVKMPLLPLDGRTLFKDPPAATAQGDDHGG